MTSDQIFTHLEYAKSMDWNELAYKIIKLGVELNEIQGSISKRKLKSFKQMISIYEDEKAIRLKKASKAWKMQDLRPLYGFDEDAGY